MANLASVPDEILQECLIYYVSPLQLISLSNINKQFQLHANNNIYWLQACKLDYPFDLQLSNDYSDNSDKDDAECNDYNKNCVDSSKDWKLLYKYYFLLHEEFNNPASYHHFHNNHNEFTLKLACLGNEEIFLNNSFLNHNSLHTDHSSLNMHIISKPVYLDKKLVQLNVFLSSNAANNSLTESAYHNSDEIHSIMIRSSDGFMLIADCTKQLSLQKVEKYYQDIVAMRSASVRIVLLIINPSQQANSTAFKQFATEKHISFVEITDSGDIPPHDYSNAFYRLSLSSLHTLLPRFDCAEKKNNSSLYQAFAATVGNTMGSAGDRNHISSISSCTLQ
jgi:hypothetical protein